MTTDLHITISKYHNLWWMVYRPSSSIKIAMLCGLRLKHICLALLSFLSVGCGWYEAVISMALLRSACGQI